jgi:hypothetical protein
LRGVQGNSGGGNNDSEATMIFEKLTPRENEVAALLLEGKTNKEIGNALNITERTARFHMRNIIAKYGNGEFQPNFYIRLNVKDVLARLTGTLIVLLLFCCYEPRAFARG